MRRNVVHFLGTFRSDAEASCELCGADAVRAAWLCGGTVLTAEVCPEHARDIPTRGIQVDDLFSNIYRRTTVHATRGVLRLGLRSSRRGASG